MDNPPPDATPQNLPSTVPSLHDVAVAALQQNPVLIVDSTESLVAAAQYLPPSWGSAVGSPNTVTHDTYLGHSAAIIWGRNDEGGRAWAETMAESVGIPSHVVTLSNAPPHWHLADGLPLGRTPVQLTGFLEASVPLARQRTNGHDLTPPAYLDAEGIPEERGRPHSTAAQFADVPAEYVRSPKGGIAKVFSNVVVLLRKTPDRWPLTYD